MKLKKSEIYEELLPEMMVVARRYLSIAKGEISPTTTKGQLEACQDIWRTLTAIAEQSTLEELLEALEKAENETA